MITITATQDEPLAAIELPKAWEEMADDLDLEDLATHRSSREV